MQHKIAAPKTVMIDLSSQCLHVGQHVNCSLSEEITFSHVVIKSTLNSH